MRREGAALDIVEDDHPGCVKRDYSQTRRLCTFCKLAITLYSMLSFSTGDAKKNYGLSLA